MILLPPGPLKGEMKTMQTTTKAILDQVSPLLLENNTNSPFRGLGGMAGVLTLRQTNWNMNGQSPIGSFFVFTTHIQCCFPHGFDYFV
jgi:hypothetical protein